MMPHQLTGSEGDAIKFAIRELDFLDVQQGGSRFSRPFDPESIPFDAGEVFRARGSCGTRKAASLRAE